MDTEDVTYFRAKEIIQNTKPEQFSIDTINDIVVDKKVQGIELPYSYKSLLYGDSSIAKRSRYYLSERGFNLEQLDQQGIGYCDEHYKAQADESSKEAFRKDYYARLIIPFKRSGKLIYYIARSILPNEPLRYKNPSVDDVGIGKSELLFNEDALNIYDDVWLFEGVFDALTIGSHCVSSQGWALSKEQIAIIRRSGCKRLWFAPDKGFYKKAVETSLQFIESEKEIYVINFDNILPNSPDLKDANELGKELCIKESERTERMTYGEAISIIMD